MFSIFGTFKNNMTLKRTKLIFHFGMFFMNTTKRATKLNNWPTIPSVYVNNLTLITLISREAIGRDTNLKILIASKTQTKHFLCLEQGIMIKKIKHGLNFLYYLIAAQITAQVTQTSMYGWRIKSFLWTL